MRAITEQSRQPPYLATMVISGGVGLGLIIYSSVALKQIAALKQAGLPASSPFLLSERTFQRLQYCGAALISVAALAAVADTCSNLGLQTTET